MRVALVVPKNPKRLWIIIGIFLPPFFLCLGRSGFGEKRNAGELDWSPKRRQGGRCERALPVQPFKIKPLRSKSHLFYTLHEIHPESFSDRDTRRPSQMSDYYSMWQSNVFILNEIQVNYIHSHVKQRKTTAFERATRLFCHWASYTDFVAKCK